MCLFRSTSGSKMYSLVQDGTPCGDNLVSNKSYTYHIAKYDFNFCHFLDLYQSNMHEYDSVHR